MKPFQVIYINKELKVMETVTEGVTVGTVKTD
jgi:hypothetical protein